MPTLAELLQEAVGHYREGRRAQSEQSCRQVLELDPRNADALNVLALLARDAGNAAAALERFRQAIAIEPSRAAFHQNLGMLYHALGREADAAAAFGRALWIEPDSAAAQNTMGVSLYALGALEEAEDRFRAAVQLAPDDAGIVCNLGTALLRRGARAEAQDVFEQALRLNPALKEARAGQRAALDRRWEPPPSSPPALNAELRLRLALLLPVIYASTEDMRAARARLEAKLGRLVAEDVRFHDRDPLSYGPPCYLAYQGMNDRGIAEALAGLFARAAPWLHFVAPHCKEVAAAETPLPRAGRPIRVGFLSLFFMFHTIGKLNVGLIRNLSRTDFRVFLLRLPGTNDALARLLQQSADEVVNLPPDLERARQMIAEQKLDVLVYTDIGIDPFTYLLAFSRLAPMQCVTWGHPVTTGIPTIDYFLSSTDLELPGADAHYHEKLVKLAHLNTFYYEPRPATPPRGRSAFGLAEDAHLYVCPQTVFKFHPEFDILLGRILSGDPAGRLVLIAGTNPGWTRLLLERLRRAFPAAAGRITVLPRLSMDDFLHLQALADVILDTLHFGGGNTSLEAFTFGTPIVTLPGPFLRSRITYACYRQMGVLDCVAADADEYVRIALELGTDRPRRDAVRARILERKHLLYENAAAVRDLEEFLRGALRVRGA